MAFKRGRTPVLFVLIYVNLSVSKKYRFVFPLFRRCVLSRTFAHISFITYPSEQHREVVSSVKATFNAVEIVGLRPYTYVVTTFVSLNASVLGLLRRDSWQLSGLSARGKRYTR